jgi:hypothetical protein
MVYIIPHVANLQTYLNHQLISTQPIPTLSKLITMHFPLLPTLLLLSTATASPLIQRACTGPSVNAATVALIKEFEGFVASPAPDPIGLPTVGYGHLCKTKGCGEVPYGFPLSQASASQLLSDDLKVRPCYAFHSNQYLPFENTQGKGTSS